MPTRLALFGLSLSMLLASLGTSIGNVALPTLAEAFGASFQDAQWVVIAYLLAVTTLIVSVGRLGDLFGRRRLLVVGIGSFMLASVSCAAAPGLPVLIAARAVQGAGAAIMMSLTMALVGDMLPKQRIGGAMGLLGTMSAIGTALGPSLGGLLIAVAGWPGIFLVNLPLGGLALLLLRHLPSDPQKRRERVRIDMAGTLLLAATLAAYAMAMTSGRGSFGLLNLGLLLIAMAGLGLFTFVEGCVAAPLLRPALLRERRLGGSLASNLLVSTVMMATLVVGPFYLSLGLGLDAASVGLVMSVGPAISALSGVPAGRLVDRLGAAFAVVAGLGAMLAGAAALAALPGLFGVAGYVAAMLLLTPGYQLFQAANNTAVMADVDPQQRGVISGVLNLSRNLGLITGASLMGAIFALGSGTTDIADAGGEAVAAGMRSTFGVAALLIVAALVVTTLARSASGPSSTSAPISR